MTSTTEEGNGKAVRPPKSSSKSLIVRRADQINPQPIKWVWPGRIALGAITAIGGDPDVGKSQLVLHCAAVISQGGEWPCREGNAPMGSVIILSAEDSPNKTIVPRLLAHQANMEKIYLAEAVREEGKEGRRPFNFKQDLLRLERLIEEIGDVMLVIVDPISVYLGVGGSSNIAVRRVLAPLAEMAERLEVAIVVITHSAKAKSRKAIFAFIDSIAFAATARAAFLVVRDPEDRNRLLFLSAKNNIAAAPEGLAFRLVPTKVGPRRDITCSVLTFESEFTDKTADEMIALTTSQTYLKFAVTLPA